jgi:uncharacterized protein (TIGR03437 family)
VITQGGVVSGASGQGLSPAQWVTIYGQNLTSLVRTLDFVNGRYPASAEGVSVTFNGQPGFLYYLSPEQLNVVSPDLVGPVQVVVTNNGISSDPVTVQLQPAAPAPFLWPGNYVVATDLNYNVKVKPSVFPALAPTPARPDEIVTLWVTGLGATNPSSAAGRAVPGTDIHVVAGTVRVRIGGVEAQVVGAALSPGFASLYQIAIRVPNLSTGDHEVSIDLGGMVSPTGVLFTVQN